MIFFLYFSLLAWHIFFLNQILSMYPAYIFSLALFGFPVFFFPILNTSDIFLQFWNLVAAWAFPKYVIQWDNRCYKL